MSVAEHQSIVQAVVSLRPGAVFVLRGDTYADLDWQDDTQSKPTEEEVAAEVERQAALPPFTEPWQVAVAALTKSMQNAIERINALEGRT